MTNGGWRSTDGNWLVADSSYWSASAVLRSMRTVFLCLAFGTSLCCVVILLSLKFVGVYFNNWAQKDFACLDSESPTCLSAVSKLEQGHQIGARGGHVSNKAGRAGTQIGLTQS